MPMAKSSPYRGVTLFRPTGKWRAQISAQSRTVSLGDHDTEEEAAQAFDRAAINRSGRSANTNFPMAIYEAEITELTGLSQEELIATLRHRARKVTSQTSSYRGVSLLKQTGKWHAQINVGGKQVHLGFYLNEQVAARAYDRAAINRCAKEEIVIATNFSIEDYRQEVQVLSAMSQEELVAALADEERRKGVMDMLAGGFTLEGARHVFGPTFLLSSGGKTSQAKAPKANRELQALKRNAPGDASTAKVNSRKQRGRETSPSTVADAVYPSLPVTQPLSSSVAPLTDAADLAHSPDDQATAVKPALESEALPAITAVTGAHSQPDRATASEPKPAGVPVTTASKRRNARAAAKNLNSNAATLAGSKRRNPTVEQQHSSKVAADGAARTIKQHTDQVDDSTTVQTAVVSPHAESVPNGAAKKCAHLKEEPHAAPVEQSGKPQLLPPPTDAPPVCEAEARQDATGKQPSGAVSAAPTESRASEPTQPPIKAEPIEATSKKPHRRMRAAAAGAASSQMVAPTGTYAQTNRGEASPQPQPSSTLKGLPSTSQTQPGSDAQPNGNIAKPPQASKQAIPTPEQTDATAAAAQQSVASLSNADVPVTNGHSMGSQQGLKLEPAVMKKRTEKPKQPATQQHAKADVAAQQADVVLSEAAQHITEVAVKSDYAAAAPAVAAPASAVGKLHAVSSSVLPVTSTEPQQPEHEDPDLIWANSTLGSNALQAKALQTTSPTRLRGATDDSTTSNDHPGIVGSATDADTSKDAVPDASAQPVAPSTADFAIAGPVTPETSPVIQQTAPLTQQAQPDTAGLPADAAAAAAQHQQASSSFIQAPMSGAIVALPISSEVANSTIDHMGTGASLSQMASIPNGPTPQLAPGSALQKQRLAMTDPSLQAAAAGSNIYHGVGGSSALVGSSPTVRTSLTEQRGVSGPAVGTQMPGTAANMHSASLGSHQVPNVLSAAQRSAHGNVGLPGQPAANSSASTLFGAHHAAYQTLPRLQSGWELSSFASDTQAVSAANPQGSNFAAPTWPHANPAYSPRPGTPASGAPQQFSMPPGAQVTVPKTHPQPTKPIPQMKLDPNLQARQMLARSNAMTNAHAIVPGMGSIPNSAISRTGTAWQVGLAAGLAATANMRPPPTSTLTHQAATTAAAARAAAAFQASRALSMAKGYTQPLQQGVAGAAPLGLSSPQAGNSIAGPDILSGGYSQVNSFINRPLITSGSGYTAAKTGTHLQSPTADSQPGAATAATAAGVSATSPRSHLMGPTTGGPAAAATAAAVATAQQKHRALQGTSMYPGGAHQSVGYPTHMGVLPGQAAAYGRAGGPQSGALAPGSTSAPVPAAHQSTMHYMPQASQAYGAQSQVPYSSTALAYGSQAPPSYALQHSSYPTHLQPSAAMQSQPQHNPTGAYGSSPQLPFNTSTGLQHQYPPQHQQQMPYHQHQHLYTTAAQPYAAAAPPPAPLRPPLMVEHLTFSKLAPQPKNAIDIISDDAVLPTFPLKKKKPKKRKYAGLDAFAAEVYRHKELAQEAHRDVLQCQVVKKGPLGRPPKTEALPKAASTSSPAPKPKSKEPKSHKAKNAAATKVQKVKASGKVTKRSPRVVFGGPGKHKHAAEPAPVPAKRFELLRPREGHMSSGLDQLLGALGEEFEAFEAEERMNEDAGEESGTDRQEPSGRGQGSSKAALGRGHSIKRGRGNKAVSVGRGASIAGTRGRGKVKGSKEVPARGGKGRKREPSSSPDRGPPKHNRRKLLAFAR